MLLQLLELLFSLFLGLYLLFGGRLEYSFVILPGLGKIALIFFTVFEDAVVASVTTNFL